MDDFPEKPKKVFLFFRPRHKAGTGTECSQPKAVEMWKAVFHIRSCIFYSIDF